MSQAERPLIGAWLPESLEKGDMRIMRAYVFFSIVEEFLYLICQQLIAGGSLSNFSGTVWGVRSAGLLRRRGMDTEKLLVLSQVFRCLPKEPDYVFLRTYEDFAEGVPMPLVV